MYIFPFQKLIYCNTLTQALFHPVANEYYATH